MFSFYEAPLKSYNFQKIKNLHFNFEITEAFNNSKYFFFSIIKHHDIYKFDLNIDLNSLLLIKFN